MNHEEKGTKMNIEDGYYWRIDTNDSPVAVEIAEVCDGEVWLVGNEYPFKIEYLARDGVTLVRIEPPSL